MTEFDKALAAKKEVCRILLHETFNDLVGSVGVGGADAETGAHYHVAVGLHREPTDDEKSRLIREYNNVPVRYKVIEPIKAL